MFKSDERSYLFVLNQLRRCLGNRKPVTKHARRKQVERRAVVEEKKKNFFDKISQTAQLSEALQQQNGALSQGEPPLRQAKSMNVTSAQNIQPELAKAK